MADISAIRTALASRLSTLVGNTGNVYTYWQSQPGSPSFQILPFGPTEYDTTNKRGGDEITVVVQGLAGTGLDEAAQRQLDDWCDTTGSLSVKAAIETERPTGAVTLGGTVDYCRVASHTQPVIVRLDNGTEVWSVDFTLEILTSTA